MTTNQQGYTPTTEEVRNGYAEVEKPVYGLVNDPERTAGFDRWLADHDAEVREGVAREIEDWFHTDEHPGMTRSEAEIYEEIVAEAARIARIARNQGGGDE